jgi:hypothetical protein
MEHAEWYGAESLQLPDSKVIRGHRLLGVLNLGGRALHVWSNPSGETVGAWFAQNGTLLAVVGAAAA